MILTGLYKGDSLLNIIELDHTLSPGLLYNISNLFLNNYGAMKAKKYSIASYIH